jgi:hypothetical protein
MKAVTKVRGKRAKIDASELSLGGSWRWPGACRV